jgi:hypothetical protein
MLPCLELEQLLEMRLAVDLSFERGKSAQTHSLIAHLTPEAALVIRVAIGFELLHQKHLNIIGQITLC